jgi:hypothetical protein
VWSVLIPGEGSRRILEEGGKDEANFGGEASGTLLHVPGAIHSCVKPLSELLLHLLNIDSQRRLMRLV